ncbi:hypothetical protein D3C78_975310 [compost metagenome]
MMGISAAVTSISRLSMPSPAKADIRCSMVPIRTPVSETSVEERRVSFTSEGCTLTLTGSGRSVRRNTMPVSGAAGFRVSFTLSPECRPTPVALIAFFKVRCKIITCFQAVTVTPILAQLTLVLY